MIQGWHNNDYLILFDEQEAGDMCERYGIAASLPGYALVGLKSWDDFILRGDDRFFTVPTVPLDAQHIQAFALDVDRSELLPDERFKNKIRWFIKPLVFGGDPLAEDNTKWITLDGHLGVVKWWNQLYRDLKTKKQCA